MVYSCTLPNIFDEFTFIIIMKKYVRLTVSLDCEFEAPELVNVKAHKRIIKGKIVKVRSYYRRVRRRK